MTTQNEGMTEAEANEIVKVTMDDFKPRRFDDIAETARLLEAQGFEVQAQVLNDALLDEGYGHVEEGGDSVF